MARTVNWSEVEVEHLPAEERMGCFAEVNLGYTAEEAIIEAQRCLQCASPACEIGCPNNNPIRDFIDLIAEGKFLEAAALDRTQNALLSCTGRVCAWENQCQGFCVMGLRGDPINIGALERFIGDYALQAEADDEAAHVPTPPNADEPKVAVIGAGPAGLTVAHFLGGKGYGVTVFDSYPVPGGVMSYGIPEFVLPQRIIDAEAERIKKLGVEFRYGVTVGRDVTIDELFEQGYAAVFIGVGANEASVMNIPGHDLKGVWTAKDFLMQASATASAETNPTTAASRNGRPRVNGGRRFHANGRPLVEVNPPAVGRRTAVIGAGNTAMDAARTAVRLGAEEVTIVYRRSEAESPSRAIEINFAKEEGVQFRYLVNPVRFIGDEHGNLTAMELVRMRLETADASGRPRPVPIEGSEHTVPVDTCIMAIGYGHEELLPRQADLAVNRWGGLIVDEETGAASRPGVFAGGDCVTGSKTVVHAIAAARKAALAIEHYLQKFRPGEAEEPAGVDHRLTASATVVG